jgi:hypothetical protein
MGLTVLILNKSRTSNVGPNVDWLSSRHFSINSIHLETQALQFIPYSLVQEENKTLQTLLPLP